MPLLCDIANALDGKVYAEVQEGLGNMIVQEFIRPRHENAPLKTVLLCESPHVYEICHRHVLAGDSGRKVTNALRHIPDALQNIPNAPRNIPAINGQDAVGCLFRDATRHPVLDSLGLMNVSLLPLQEAPYCQPIRQDDDYKKLLCSFETIRTRSQSGKHALNFRPPTNADEGFIRIMQRTPQIILQELRGRLCELPDSVLVIPCGHFARNFLQRAESEWRRQFSKPLRRELMCLRHPARWPGRNKTWGELPDCIRKLLLLICRRAFCLPPA